MNHKRKMLVFQSGTMYPLFVSIMWVNNIVADLVLVGVGLTSLGAYIRLIVKGDPEAKAVHEAQLRRTHIEELEKDLGFEPLNLHELDEILAEDQKLRKEKEA